jgi:hypothetical protein
MNQIDLDKSDEAFIIRANLLFHLNVDAEWTWENHPHMIQAWQDVFRAFTSDGKGLKSLDESLLLYVLIEHADDAGHVLSDVSRIKACARIRSDKTLQNALLSLEKGGWICRLSKNEVCLEPRLVERAKRIYAKLASAAGYDVNMDTQSGEIPAQTQADLIVRQTSLRSAEP